jgi:hypothetical protein
MLDMGAIRARVYRLSAIILSLSITLSILLATLIPASAGDSSRLSLPDSEENYDSQLAMMSAIAPQNNSSALIAESRFDLDDEGWTVNRDGMGPTHQAAGGNPSGHISASDGEWDPNWYWYWVAPDKFLSDISAAYGGTLSFDLMQSQTDNQISPDDRYLSGDVFLEGIDTDLVLDLPVNPGTDWTRYTLLLHESAGWTKNSHNGFPATADEIIAVLSNVESIKIRGEYRHGPDSGGLDNVVLQGRMSCPTADDLIVTNGMTCWLEAGNHTYNSITIENRGNVLVSSDLDQGTGVTLITDEMRIETGGRLSADATGYISGHGPGSPLDCGPAGHGGWGGGRDDALGEPYGDFYYPIALGSGGQSCTDEFSRTYPGGAGGGAIKLVVQGSLTIDGSLTARGGDGGLWFPGEFAWSTGPGSGGSIWIEAGNLSGTGSIDADGGSGLEDGGELLGYGGAGGRISIYASASTFSGIVRAQGGAGTHDDDWGGPGTVYWGTETRLVVDNGAHDAQSAALMEGDYSLTSIELTGYGHLEVLGEGSRLAVATDATSGDGSSRLKAFGTVVAPSSFTISGIALDIEGELSGVSDLIIAGDASLLLHAHTPLHSGAYTFDSLTIQSGGLLTLAPYDNGDEDYSNDAPFELEANSLTVESGAVITADGFGYSSGRGPGRGEDATGSGTYSGGAGYGAPGGEGYGDIPGGPAYGDMFQPLDLGSGGGRDRFGNPSGGIGGGAIKLVVAGTLHVDGAISASALDDSFQGGGSGGSIWIEAGRFDGSGHIKADGGSACEADTRCGGGGAGGRIAVYADAIDPGLSFSAAGGEEGRPGGDGTIGYATQLAWPAYAGQAGRSCAGHWRADLHQRTGCCG